MRIFNLVVIILALVHLANAQTVSWALQPRYTSIEPLTENLYKIGSGGKYGIATSQGNILFQTEADSITFFVEDYALILNKEGTKYKIAGILNRKGEIKTPAQTCFVTTWPYFQQGYLVVANTNGVYGFLNTSGEEAITCKYKQAHPFSGGYASVTLMNNRVIYINTFEQPLQLEPGDGEIYMGTTFSNGEALVCTSDKKMYIINSGGTIKNKIKLREIAVDPMYCLCTEGVAQSAPVIQHPRFSTAGPTPFIENGKYGYKNNAYLVLPAQFTQADQFRNNVARVMQGSHSGLLRIVSFDTITTHLKANRLEVKQKVPQEIQYAVTLPRELTGNELELSFTDPNQATPETRIPIRSGNPDMIPKFTPAVVKGVESYTCAYTFQIRGGGLLYKEEVHTISFRKIPEYTCSVSPQKGKAGEDDSLTVTLYLSNASDFPIKLSIKAEGKTVAVDLKAFQKSTSYVTFKDIKAEEKRSISISVPNGRKQVSYVQVEPFYKE